jgi:predicted RNA-binding Zn ribbon-like protein
MVISAQAGGHAAAHADTVGGALCLDFTNTVSARGFPGPTDRLASYHDLVAWSEGAGALSHATAAALLDEAGRHPAQAEQVVRHACALREALYRIFAAQIAGQLPDDGDLALLNAAVGAAMGHLRLQPGQSCCVWSWEAGTQALDQMLWPIVRSAADLLTSGDLSRVRQCAGDRCGWLFVDRSKNHSRRWCDMAECGNVAKVRRHRRRKAAEDA